MLDFAGTKRYSLVRALTLLVMFRLPDRLVCDGMQTTSVRPSSVNESNSGEKIWGIFGGVYTRKHVQNAL